MISNPATTLNEHPVGTGAYELSSISGQTMTFTANPHYYFPGLPKFKTIRFLAFSGNTTSDAAIESGEVDWAGSYIPGIQKLYLAKNKNCVVCTEHAHEAVIVEGTAEIADVPARRKLLSNYGRKYKWDMSAMKEDILSMKEPVFSVRPRVVFGLWEKEFMGKSTRWKFE